MTAWYTTYPDHSLRHSSSRASNHSISRSYPPRLPHHSGQLPQCAATLLPHNGMLAGAREIGLHHKGVLPGHFPLGLQRYEGDLQHSGAGENVAALERNGSNSRANDARGLLNVAPRWICVAEPGENDAARGEIGFPLGANEFPRERNDAARDLNVPGAGADARARSPRLPRAPGSLSLRWLSGRARSGRGPDSNG